MSKRQSIKGAHTCVHSPGIRSESRPHQHTPWSSSPWGPSRRSRSRWHSPRWAGRPAAGSETPAHWLNGMSHWKSAQGRTLPFTSHQDFPRSGYLNLGLAPLCLWQVMDPPSPMYMAATGSLFPGTDPQACFCLFLLLDNLAKQ